MASASAASFLDPFTNGFTNQGLISRTRRPSARKRRPQKWALAQASIVTAFGASSLIVSSSLARLTFRDRITPSLSML